MARIIDKCIDCGWPVISGQRYRCDDKGDTHHVHCPEDPNEPKKEDDHETDKGL